MDRETALRELSHGLPDHQRRAARVLGRWTDDQVLTALISALHSPHRGIREAATDTLLEIGDARAVRFLVPLLRNSIPAVRNAARLLLQGLAKAAPEILLEISRDPDPRMRIFAANIMTESGDHEMAAPLLALLDDAEENVRDAAVVGLGRLGAPEAVSRLEEFASTGSSWTRFSAIDALSQIPSPDAVRALIRLVSGGPEDLREPVIEALGRHGSLEAVAPLVQAVRQSAALGSAVVSALAGLPAAEVVARMEEADRPGLADAVVRRLEENGASPEHTAGALDLLGTLGVRVGAEIFVRLLASPVRKIQQAAIRAAVRLRLQETVPLLRQLQSQSDPLLAQDVRAALDALDRSGKEPM